MSTLSVTNNLLALGASRRLTTHYAALADSVRHMASGLRVQQAADDAAGLAIRELMRADMAALGQGARNANDAISLIQTADGALAVIDEKLIRMKELAEQAATGTYDSTQRLIIDSEFQQMASEIDRIAKSTEFNGVKLLDGSLSGPHDGSGAGSEDGLSATGALKVHFGTANDSAEDYYYINIGDCTLAGLGLRGAARNTAMAWWEDQAHVVIDYTAKTILFDIDFRAAGVEGGSVAAVPTLQGIDFYELPVGMTNVEIISNSPDVHAFFHKPHVCLFSRDGMQLTGPPIDGSWSPRVDYAGKTRVGQGFLWWNSQDSATVIRQGIQAGIFDQNAHYTDNTAHSAGETRQLGSSTITMVTDQDEIGSGFGRDTVNFPPNDEIIHIDVIDSDLVFLVGGHAGENVQWCNEYSLSISANINDEFLQEIERRRQRNMTAGAVLSIQTQELAQEGLQRINAAIVRKDQVRAHLGATQNRLENTVTNLTIQAENLQNAESRISDTDVATEMTTFVRNQVLTQSTSAMLSQANAFPHMLLQLLQG